MNRCLVRLSLIALAVLVLGGVSLTAATSAFPSAPLAPAVKGGEGLRPDNCPA
jgi:hypothetical protein